MTGRQCTQVESGYFFMALDHFLHEAEVAMMGQVSPIPYFYPEDLYLLVLWFQCVYIWIHVCVARAPQWRSGSTSWADPPPGLALGLLGCLREEPWSSSSVTSPTPWNMTCSSAMNHRCVCVCLYHSQADSILSRFQSILQINLILDLCWTFETTPRAELKFKDIVNAEEPEPC